MRFEKYTYTLPIWTLCPLFNGDTTGTTNEEDDLLFHFEKMIHRDHGPGFWAFPGDSDQESYFSHHNDLDRLGGDVIDLVYMAEVQLPFRAAPRPLNNGNFASMGGYEDEQATTQ